MNAIRLALATTLLVIVLAGCTNPPATTPPPGPATPAGTFSTTPGTSSTNPQTPATGTIRASTVPSETSTTEPVTSSKAPTGETVVINNIFFTGSAGSNEADEYVEIQNWQDIPMDVTGWVLKNINNGATFRFPSCVLQPYEIVRVYTNEIHPEFGSFSFESDRAIWDNKSSNTAVLYDAQGREISRRSY
jgi:hypothetical protein